ncbi:sporulation protein YpjB [Lentibacillus saliphilus]|uniref:sporulation protein YpjB n=1 Tax=Lentibacillus saliphilus TaxID=2737028 RepID=UPI001C305728|nr:sporulation protein YpjB [Lentibacillus saliphilus]
MRKPTNRLKHRLMFLFVVGLIWIIFVNVTGVIVADSVQSTAQATDMTPFYWLVSIVGGSIIATLVYVGWKKYRAEHKKQEKDHNS